MRENGIPFDTSDRGLTIYMLEDQVEVLGIIRRVQNPGELRDSAFESTNLFGDNMKNLYIEEFEKAGVHYWIEEFEDSELIYWKESDGPVVDRIRQQLNFQLREQGKVQIKQAER